MSENNKSGQQGLSITFVWLAVTFCVCLVTSNLFVPRLWQVGKFSLQLSGAVVIFPISYIINDLLTEVYGYRRAMQVIWMGFALSAFVAIAAQLVSWLPAPLGSISFHHKFTNPSKSGKIRIILKRDLLNALACHC